MIACELRMSLDCNNNSSLKHQYGGDIDRALASQPKCPSKLHLKAGSPQGNEFDQGENGQVIGMQCIRTALALVPLTFCNIWLSNAPCVNTVSYPQSGLWCIMPNL